MTFPHHASPSANKSINYWETFKVFIGIILVISIINKFILTYFIFIISIIIII